MRSFLLSSALLIVAVSCGYPVPEAYPTAPPAYPTAPPPTYPTPVPKKYPVAPTYPTKPTYAAAPEYPQKPTYSAPPAPVISPSGYTSAADTGLETAPSDSAVDYTTAASLDYRKRAKARTSHNRQFHRRALEPIRRFQQKQ